MLGLYALAALIVPTMTAAAVGDDWVYARSVEILLLEGRLHVFDLAVVTLIFQVFWGALFDAIFGIGFGSLRLSTVVLTLFGGWACYGLCRELGVGRGRSALAAAAYLFNPLAFALAYSFLTDAPFAALLTVSALGYVRGLRLTWAAGSEWRAAGWMLLGGAAAAALAFLVRQQGALIPPAVVLALLLQGRLRIDWASLRLVLRIVAIPAAAIVLYYLWLFFVNGVPEQQESFTRQIREAGWEQSWLLIRQMTFIEAMYVGLFALPLVVAALGAMGRLLRFRSVIGWTIVAAWATMLVAGLIEFDAYGFDIPPMPRMPYIPQYLGPTGIGPADIQGGRPWLVRWWFLDILTAACAVASLVFALLLARRLDRRAQRAPGPDPTRVGAGMVLLIAAGQVAGVLPPSFHFRNWIISVDRYLLPLLPLTLALGVWALRGLRLRLGGAWTIVVLGGLLSVAGTRDFLVFQGATWDLARAAVQMGIPLQRLDAGAAWDGYYLYEFSVANGIKQQTPGGPWWTNLFGPATNSDYVVSTTPLNGYDAIAQLEYSSWLGDEPSYLLLLRRQGVPGPP